jgi:penicillin-binding protein 2
MMEKFLNDTLRPERAKEVERIANSNLMPGFLVREQFREDSIRAWKWFKLTKDTNVIRKYIRGGIPHNEPAKAPADNKMPLMQKSPAIKQRDSLKTNQKPAIT